jgi:hypothetical protein
VRPTISFHVRQKKTWSLAPKIRSDDKGNQQEFAKKKERNQTGRGACCKVFFSLFDVVEFSSFMIVNPGKNK